jgi:two-component system response regulator NreC
MRVLLVDDHPVVREAIRFIWPTMDSTIEIVGEAETEREALVLVESLRPDLVVMDMLMPGSGGLVATRKIRLLGWKCKIVVYTTLNQPPFAKEALAAGADGFVLKTEGVEALRNAVERIMSGQTYVSEGVMQHLAYHPAPAADGLSTLSRREREIFEIVVKGSTNAEVSALLFISVKTVETHRSRINQKLGVHSTGQLIRFAALSGLISA